MGQNSQEQKIQEVIKQLDHIPCYFVDRVACQELAVKKAFRGVHSWDLCQYHYEKNRILRGHTKETFFDKVEDL